MKDLQKELIELDQLINNKKLLIKNKNHPLLLEHQNLTTFLLHSNNKLKFLLEQKDFLEKEVIKTKKYIHENQEQLEFGLFFDGLEIKVCPHCEKEINETRKQIERESHQCMICNEPIKHKIDKEIYKQRVEELKTQLENLESSFIIVEENMRSEKAKNLKIQSDLELIETKLNEYNHNIIEEVENFLIKKGALTLQIKDLEQNPNDVDINRINNEISVLDYAIELLESERYDASKEIFTRFKDLMLKQLTQFGLTNITDIIIDESLGINFFQNNTSNSFDKLNEGEQLRVKISFFLSLIQLDIEYKVGRHPRFLIIDSPGKEEVVKKDLAGLSEVFKSIDKSLGKELQILIGTALPEFKEATTDPKKVEIKNNEEFIF